jgi:anti-sigma regulatory factor (Ser/Thr protein kinase)
MESGEFIATKDQLKNIRAFVRSYLNEKDFSKDETEKIILAVGEASMNIVQHAYNGGNEGKKIKVEIEIKEKKLFVHLFDKGKPAVPENIKPRDLKDIKPGGLGSFFIGEIMDEVKFMSKGKDWINHLVLTKYLK